MHFKIQVIFLVTLLCFACSKENNTPDHLSVESFETLPMETVFEFSESDEVVFQQIYDMGTDNNGNIIVHDFSQPFLFVFNDEGNFLTKIGREGMGPGEFQNVVSFLVDQNYLWAIDSRSIKIERFEYQDSEYVHLNTIALENSDLTGGFLGKSDDGILVRNRYTLNANSLDNPTEQPITLIDESFEILRDSILTVPVPEQIRVSNSGNTLLTSKSYGNRSLLAFDSINQIFTLWTDSLSIDTYTIDGEREHAFSHALEPVQLTEQEKDSVVTRYPEIFRSDIRRQLPDVKPIVNNLILDDRQRIWTELLTEELGRGWFCFSQEGEPLYKIDIPRVGAVLQQISGNQVLWNYINEDGIPTIAKSIINIPEI